MFLWHGWHTILPISLIKGLFFVCFLLQQKQLVLSLFIVNILKKNDKNRNTQRNKAVNFFLPDFPGWIAKKIFDLGISPPRLLKIRVS